MGSTERAPEPTMEEILASIRRIITDDEAGQAEEQNAIPKAQAENESLEGDADNQIIDDIARVLSGDPAEAPASDEEEILDLTDELGGLEIVEDEGDAVVEITEVREHEVIVTGMPAEPQIEQPQAEASPEAQGSVPEPVAEMPQPQEETPPVQGVQSAGEEAASALERAIAALRAGQSPASTKPPTQPFAYEAPQPDTRPTADEEPEPIPMAVPMSSPEAEAETHPEPEPVVEPDAEINFEAQPKMAPTIEPMTEEQLVEDQPSGEQTEKPMLTDAEFTLTGEIAEAETDEESPFWAVQGEAQAETEEKLPFWPVQGEAQADEPGPEPEPIFEPEPVFEPSPVFEREPETSPEPFAAQANGAEGQHDVAGKTLEDSIKDMLRPMLRQWLDENMPRMIREEFDPETLRDQQD